MTYRARYVDPDTGRTVRERLDPVALPSAETRRDWAIKKSKALAKRRTELDLGGTRATGTSLETALGRYYEDHGHLRSGTIDIYKAATTKLEAWARSAGVRTGDDLTGPKLVAFRAALAKEKRPVPARGGRRGERRRTGEPRAATTINRELRSVRTVLGYLRSLGLLARLGADELAAGLKRMVEPKEVIEFLRPQELRALLDAALAHDETKYAETRAEHRGLLPPGSTPRYEMIAPMVLCAMLTGARLGEVVTLTWPQVDLDALGADDEPAGVITLKASGTKTKQGRQIMLDHCPALRDLLVVLRPEHARGSVWGLTREQAKAAAKRLDKYDAPEGWNWKVLRSTCGTYLTNAPSIFGAASAYRSAKLLGHSVEVAEKHYVGLWRVSREAKTLEAAMQIEAQVKRLIEAAKVRMGQ